MSLAPVHILNQMGVIISFAVAKKISEEEITKFFAKGKKDGKSIKELNNIIKLIESHDKPDKKQILKVLGLFFKLLTEGAIILKHFL